VASLGAVLLAALAAARTETGYDQVIEGIIASFRLISPGG